MTKLSLISARVLTLAFALTVASFAGAQEPTNAAGADTTAAKTDTSEKTEKPAKKKSVEKKADKHKDKKEKEKSATKSEDLPKDVKKLIVQDTLQGTGKVATRGKTIKVNYTGWLYDPAASMGRGKEFDTSVGKEPFSFKLGAGDVIKGWDEGFADMKVGGKRKLIVPSELGYGDRGAGNVIPPNSSLMFEVELIDVM
jgi:FKBP-type peptidyl-prolyl cis-trans isomerase FkpA